MSDPSTLTFERSAGGRLHVAPEAFEVLQSYCQTEPSDTEAGGVLLGRYLLGSRDVVVDRVTTPLRGDRRTRTSFDRHHAGHQSIIDRVWAASGGRCAWLGEWHTHPEPTPTPSWVDRRDWRRRLRRDVFDETLFFLIVGTDQTRAWEGRRLHHLIPLTYVRETRPQPRHRLEEERDAQATQHSGADGT